MDFGTYHHSNPDESREMRNRAAGAFSAVLLTRYEPHSEIRILDAGCGLGFLSYVAAKTFPEGVITGIDTFDHKSLSHSSMINAENNMKLLEVDSRVHFFEHDLTLPIRSKVKQESNDRQKEILEKLFTKKEWERRIYGDRTKSGNTKNLIYSLESPKRVMKPASKYRSHG